MHFSPEKYMEWLQDMAKKEGGHMYNFLEKLKDVIKGNYHKGRMDAFHEAQQMCAGDGPCYVCNSGKQPVPDLVNCLFATLIKEKMIEHLKEKHEMEYKNPDNVDRFHKYEKMKDA